MLRVTFIILVFLTMTFSQVSGGEHCNENKKLAATFLNHINKIKNKSELTKEDIQTLIRPLHEGFNLDWGSCVGFNEPVWEATKKVLSHRAKELTETLIKLCSQSIPDTKDILMIAAIMEEKEAAKKALKLIGHSTYQCSE